MNRADASVCRDGHRWVVFGAIGLVYFLVYFHRVSTSVIVDDLLSAFQTHAAALGFMSSMYFYLYAFEQPFVGWLTDRLGPRRVIGYSSIIGAAGCFLFGLAPGIAWASAGRALIGIGVGGVYVPAMKALALWFSLREFAGMLGLLMAIGNLGAVVATTPLAWAADTWGWRPTFHLIGAITLVLALFTLVGTRDHKVPGDGHAGPRDGMEGPSCGTTSRSRPAGGVSRVLRSWNFWVTALLFFGVYGTLLTLQGLWATPFLMSVLGIERMPASQLNMLIPIGVIVGAPAFGWLSGRSSGLEKNHCLIVIVAGCTIFWIALVFFYAALGLIGLALVLFGMGVFAGAFLNVLWAIVKEATDPTVFGKVCGMLNPAPFLGVAAFQVVTGAILDRAGANNGLYNHAGFEQAFGVCLTANLICLAFSCFMRREEPRQRFH